MKKIQQPVVEEISEQEGDFTPPPTRSGKLNVNLVYRGKNKPIPEESPWAEEDSGGG